MLLTHQIVNPFPGLRPFQLEDQHLFFGREGQEMDLIRILRDHRFLAVIGASGTGKSSLVRCGLVSAFHHGYLNPSHSDWRIATFRPGSSPLERLTEVLIQDDVLGSPEESMEFRRLLVGTNLRRSSAGLVDAFRYANLPLEGGLIVVVDQFEELFRFDSPTIFAEASRLVSLLLTASNQSQYPIYIVITLRSDFIGDCVRFWGLPEMINRAKYLVPRMNREALKAAIVNPIMVMGQSIRSRLVQRILQDIGEASDHLPVMQHAMMRTWDYWKRKKDGKALDIVHYEAVGGMAEALSRHAEEAFCELEGPVEKGVAAFLFKALTTRGKHSMGIRRPQSIQKLAALADCTEDQIIKVIEVFRQKGRAFLLPAVGKPLTSQVTIDIAHESLMRTWTRLKNWVEEEAQSAEFYLRLAKTASYHRLGKVGFLKQPELQLAINWRRAQLPSQVWADQYMDGFDGVMTFLEMSREADEAEQALWEKVRRRQLIRTRWFALVLGTLASLAITLCGVAMAEKSKAHQSAILASQAWKLSESEKENAMESEAIAEVMRKDAEEKGRLAALERDRADSLAHSATQEAFRANQERARAERGEFRARNLMKAAEAAKIRAEKNSKLAEMEKLRTESAKEETERLNFLAIARNMALRSLQEEDSIARGIYALKAFELQTIHKGPSEDPAIYNALLKANQAIFGDGFNALRAHSNALNSISWSPNGHYLASSGSDGRLMLWDSEQGHLRPQTIFNGAQAFGTLAFHPEGKWLCFSNKQTIYVRDLRFGPEKILSMENPFGPIRYLKFSEDGEKILVGGLNREINLWQWRNRKLLQTWSLPEQAVAMDFNPVSRQFFITTLTGKVCQLELKAGELTSVSPRSLPLEKLKGPPLVICQSLDGSHLALGDQQGKVVVWNLEQGRLAGELHANGDETTVLRFSPDENWLAAASLKGEVRVLPLGDNGVSALTLQGHTHRIRDLAFSRNSRELISAGEDKVLRIWPLKNSCLADKLSQTLELEITEAMWQEVVGDDQPYSIEGSPSNH